MAANVWCMGVLGCVCAATAIGQVSPSAANKDASGTSDIGSSANFNQVQTFQHGGVYYMGKVAVAGGALPWDPIPVVVTCNGVPRLNTVTDDKGGFRIQSKPSVSEVGLSNSNPNALVPANLVGCKISAVLQGFQSSTLKIMNNSMLDNADLGTITLTRDEKSAGAALSATSQTASKDAQKNFDKARLQAMSHHPDDAERSLEKAVKADPKFAEAWYQLGKIQEDQKKPQDAYESYSKAVAADPDLVPAYMHQAAAAALLKNWKAVEDAANESLKRDPQGTPQVWYYKALGDLNTGDRRDAQTSAEKSLAMDPSHLAPNTEQLLAVILASHGDYAGALQHLQHCLTYTPPGPNADMMKQQIAQLEKMSPSASAH